MSDTPLVKRFEQAYKEQEFSALELVGFQSKPELAFLAGAAIGYRMSGEDITAAIAANGGKDD